MSQKFRASLYYLQLNVLRARRPAASTWCCRRVRPRIQRICPRGVRSSTVSSSGSGCLSLSSISCLSAAGRSRGRRLGNMSVGTLVTSCNDDNNYQLSRDKIVL